ncbi:adhesin [Campylobacterota bacterium]|nr:adhesin [Campylobacterota bacterium]
MKRILFFLFCVLSLEAKIVVAVSVAPQAWLAKSIGGDIEVITLAPANSSSHSYEPKIADLVQIARADMYLACGIEFEKAWLNRFGDNAPKIKIFYTDRNIVKILAHDEPDTHIWLSPENMRTMAEETVRAFMTIDAKNSAIYLKNGADTIQKIEDIQNELNAKFAPYKNRAFLVYHPALGYFAQEFNLRQIAIEHDHLEPKPAQLGAIITIAREQHIKTIFIEPNTAHKTASVVADTIGAKIVAVPIVSDDWITLIEQLAANILRAFDESN